MPPQRNRKITNRRWSLLLIIVVWLAALSAIIIHQQAIVDWIRLRGYTPPASIVQLADQDGMNAYTKHLFYLNRPQLLPTVASFRQHCPENADTIVLGCYHSGQNGIFIYNVQDPTLAGIQQVTAAHEVLHAIYARLSNHDRQTLDTQLENYYQHDLHDPRVIAEVKLYQQTEPNDVMDEMSCTFGTEVADLPSSLETYYNHYFTNRSAIVAYEQKYEAEFTERLATINQYDAQLSGLKDRINSAETDLKAKQATINSQQASLLSERASDTAAYNAGVTPYNQLVDAYNAEITSTQSLIGQYNQLVATRNVVAGQVTTLDNAIDTRLTPHSTQ